MTNLRWKILTVLVVFVVFAAVGVYPILASRYGLPAPGWLKAKELKLGLDLQGGVHLVLQVQTDDALKFEIGARDGAAARGAAAAEHHRRRTSSWSIPRASPSRACPADKDAEFRNVAVEVETNFDRSSGTNGTYTFTMKPNVAGRAARGGGDPGAADDRAARQRAGRGRADHRAAGREQRSDPRAAARRDRRRSREGNHPVDGSARAEAGRAGTGVDEGGAGRRAASCRAAWRSCPAPATTGGATVYYLVKKVPVVSGVDLKNARPAPDENNRPAVSFTLSTDGGRRFGKFTSENIGRRLAIVLDGRVQSAPSIDGRITTDGRIYGNFTQQEAQDLALILRSGALLTRMDYLEEQTIGPSLGADAIRSGVHRLARRPAARSSRSCSSTTSSPASTPSWRWSSTW